MATGAEVAPCEPYPYLKAGAALAALVSLVLVWRLTPLREFATAEHASVIFESYRAAPLAPALIIFVFIVGGLAAFPVTVSIVATTAAFGIWPGALYAASGSLASAAAEYCVGRAVGAARVRRLLGPRANRIAQGVARQGALAVMTIRIVPVAPFSIVNLVAGALSIGFAGFMLGTLLGLAPGFVILAFAGDRVSSFIAHPSAGGAAVIGLVLFCWLTLSVALQAVVRRRAKA